MPAPRKYNDELRDRAVRVVNETMKDNRLYDTMRGERPLIRVVR